MLVNSFVNLKFSKLNWNLIICDNRDVCFVMSCALFFSGKGFLNFPKFKRFCCNYVLSV